MIVIAERNSLVIECNLTNFLLLEETFVFFASSAYALYSAASSAIRFRFQLATSSAIRFRFQLATSSAIALAEALAVKGKDFNPQS
ncbi:MAG: hypothetical protein A2509_04970 [Candidatus Edwardsbacteria bacterium RIFOXYD12_FULL_50_11]|uniref:Uncharacterized protein n=1 Tax=Candidatus Edwardsbacteria bacterium GWF2_54_11 TaxID=1817851 RepID=A0A1F5RHM2_9BACT|nr:MAG: hypothetical protein A2502_01115 [Candidatus Edwardsbacteria bacterium RifOxyC12_full_54_24]OGF06103.1 MAG: hypothetical protein A2273_11065 [Candidatus Edwardsbacteria bacterium RifOxyA12_full_54_48]OGF13834.1 MAG: hypothetical protein A2024_10305 [Candidatus Edwardsbacteria bacterium GWF2_54_11]OGF17839.1 MAG: hypothetical protein A2509_04970 [Candidatus Edwardsbacteria bacterium RIFOXYD12_FULL_50_11]OGJ18995.1 MAG: hypothetical protein A2349_12390 [Candidatus Edwardsbacteria bacteriu